MSALFQRRGAETPRNTRKIFSASLRLGVVFFASFVAVSAQALLYIGAWPKQILVIDEAQQKVIDHIQLETGAPRHIEISNDRKKLFVNTWVKNGVEVIDLATRKVVNHFELDAGGRRVFFFGFTPDPQDKLLYTITHTSIKQVDRFELEPTKLAVIDLAQKKIVKTVDYPKEEEGVFARWGGLRVSPDGKHLYQFRENVLIFDTTDFKLEEKIELAKPSYPGMEHVGLPANNDPADDPGIMQTVFNAADPVVHRAMFGIARVDLSRRNFDFTPVGPATLGMMDLRVSPDRKTGYTVAFTHNDPGNRRCEFWVFDLEARKLVRKAEFPARTRFDFSTSSTGKELYIFGAGPTLEIYDANTLQLVKSINLEADTTTDLIVVPAKVAQASLPVRTPTP